VGPVSTACRVLSLQKEDKGKGKGCPVTCQAGTEGERGIVLPTLEPALKGVGG
jgi:hypothetical protein